MYMRLMQADDDDDDDESAATDCTDYSGLNESRPGKEKDLHDALERANQQHEWAMEVRGPRPHMSHSNCLVKHTTRVSLDILILQ